jgi:hypothetical protein
MKFTSSHSTSGIGVGTGVGVEVGELVDVGVWEGVWEAVAVSVPVGDGVRVGLLVGAWVMVSVGDALGGGVSGVEQAAQMMIKRIIKEFRLLIAASLLDPWTYADIINNSMYVGEVKWRTAESRSVMSCFQLCVIFFLGKLCANLNGKG